MLLLDDLRHAARRLRSRPAMTGIAAGLLGLAIALTTAMFTLVDALVLRPVPFPDPDRLTGIVMWSGRTGRTTVPPAVLETWRSSPAFESAEGATPRVSIIEANAGSIVRASARVSPGIFRMLRAGPARGRLFDVQEGRPGTDDRVLLSEDLWRSAFGADPKIIGRRIVVDGSQVEVVGLMPAAFRFPEWNTVIWRPVDYGQPPPDMAGEAPRPYVRLAPGVPLEDALRTATAIVREADPSLPADTRAASRPVTGAALDPYYQRAVPLLAGGVAMVFLVLCANVCGLLLARLNARQHEFRICSMLGASRMRILRQAFVEHVMLGIVAAAAGVSLASVLVALARGVVPDAFILRSLNPVDLDRRALVVAVASAIAGTVAAGLLPAWIATRATSSGPLANAERTVTESRTARGVTRGLLVAELALACTLLLGATLLVRSFVNLASADRGLQINGVITTWISLPTKTFPDRASRQAVTAALEASVRRLPGVDRIALSSGLPPGGAAIHFGDRWLADGLDAKPQDLVVSSFDVGQDFFALYSIPLLRGRTFQPGDTAETVIVGERLAARLWPGQDPVGRSFRFDKTQMHVIGLAREINFPSLEAGRDLPEFYRPYSIGSGYVFMNIRCQSRCPDEAVLRRQILSEARGATIVKLGMLSDAYAEELARPRAAAGFAGTFAILAVLAAAAGLFSALSYTVRRRRREFGIRCALGAPPARIRQLVFRDGLQIAGAGVGIGLLASSALARALSSLEYGITSFDPATWIGVVLLLGAATVLAATQPARVASRVDPVTLLREE